MKEKIKNFCAEIPKKIKQSKYKSKITYVDNLRFASKHEANYYCVLKLLLKSGAVLKFQRQPIFRFKFKHRTGYVYKLKYYGDFRVWFKTNADKKRKWVIVDCKGVKTDEYKIRKKLMKDILNIEIHEVFSR